MAAKTKGKPKTQATNVEGKERENRRRERGRAEREGRVRKGS